jgi:putative Mg2+ transporter-C (MgtC) family protein
MHITDVLDEIFAFDPLTALSHLITLALALVITLPIAWNRERSNRIGGFRTFPLVAMASAAYILIARETLTLQESPGHEYVIQGLMTGLGFLGAGTIIKGGDDGGHDRVEGLATATALWSTAAIGAAVAYRRLEIAVLLSIVVWASLRALRPVKERIDEERDRSRRRQHVPAAQE